MSTVQMFLWILAFAFMTAILYGIGLWKSMHRQQELVALLFIKGERKIRKALAAGNSMTGKELEKLLAGTRACLFYSRQKLTVQDPKPFTNTLLMAMVKKGILSENTQGRDKTYRLPSNVK